MNTKPDLKNYTEEKLSDILVSIGEKPFRAKQIYKWLYRGVTSFNEMTDISISLREKLAENYRIGHLDIERKQVSAIDGTIKYLFKLFDGNFIESVLMKYNHGNTICVSSQVGCSMGCRFCASTIGGKIRDLYAGEISDQIITAQNDTGEKISNVVMMGMGEPLDNYENVITFLKNAQNPNGLGIGYRHFTLSTCGICDKMIKLAHEEMPITLSVSLHSPFDDERSKIMPVNKKYPLNELCDTIREYIKITGRRISIEYALINGENDTFECADEILKLFSGMLTHINLIPVNPVAERSYKKSTPQRVNKFADYLNSHGMTATVRRKLGSDIDAACGQLRKKTVESRGDAF